MTKIERLMSWPLLPVLREGFGDLLLPVLIIIGIFGGFVTVSEAAACTACGQQMIPSTGF